MVDDGSMDDSAEIARKQGAIVLQLPHQSGPAAARNHGAQKAQGDILLFVDSDVVIQQRTIERVIADFQKNPDIDAVFGSYDDEPAEKNFCSQYKNLYHHFVHQQSSRDAQTFWAGCGAIRQDAFHKVGGFDQKKYSKPSIEDIELGYRLRRKGYRILLDKELQVKHLKRWSLGGLLRTDIFCRAVPWSKLILESRQMANDLNLRMSDRVSAGLVILSIGILPFSFFRPQILCIIPPILAIILALNRKLYVFFLKRKGLKYAVLVFPLHLLYYLYSSIAFAVCRCMHIFLRSQRKLKIDR